MKTEVQPVNDKNINSCDWLEESIYIADIAKIAEGHGQRRPRATTAGTSPFFSAFLPGHQIPNTFQGATGHCFSSAFQLRCVYSNCSRASANFRRADSRTSFEYWTT